MCGLHLFLTLQAYAFVVLVYLLHEVSVDGEGVAGLKGGDALEGNIYDTAAVGAVKMGVGAGVLVDVDVVVVNSQKRHGTVVGQHLHSVVDGGARETGMIRGEGGIDVVHRGMTVVCHQVLHNIYTRVRDAHATVAEFVRGSATESARVCIF